MEIQKLMGLAGVLLIASCSSTKKSTETTTVAAAPVVKEYTKVTKDSLKSIMARVCTDMRYEFTDLYSSPQALPDEESLVLDDPLKAKGFNVINTARGNWDKGPRTVDLTLETASCICNVGKRYHNIEGISGKYRVTETIECHKR